MNPIETASAIADERLAAALERQGYLVIDAALPTALADTLRAECLAAGNAGFRPAGVGRETGRQLNTAVRTDEICWLEGATPASGAYLAFMEQLRVFLNGRLFLGLCDYECHYARYLPGTCYLTHLDAFEGSRNRVLSTVLYLNPCWQADDGGELVLYAPDAVTVVERIVPEHNRMVIYLSERFPHEVKPVRRTRYSLTGWFRVKPLQSWRRPG